MRKGKYKKCKYCGIEFYEFPYLKGKKKFCSTNCANKYNADKLSKNRKGKGNPMYNKIPWNKGKIGVQKSIKGVNHHWWKGGISDESKLARISGKWKEWRKKVFKRDNYTCQICKIKGGNLIPHHIKLFRFYKKDRFDLKNGVTLCSKCHRGLHNKNVDKKIIKI